MGWPVDADQMHPHDPQSLSSMLVFFSLVAFLLARVLKNVCHKDGWGDAEVHNHELLLKLSVLGGGAALPIEHK